MKRIVRNAAAATGLAMVVPTAMLTTPALADTGVVDYSCKITDPITVVTPTSAQYDTDLPERLYIGDPAFVADLDHHGAVPAGSVDQARGFPYNARFVEGTMDLPFTWNGAVVQVSTETDRKPLVAGQAADLSKVYPDVMTLPVPASTGEYQLTLSKKYTSTNKLFNGSGGLAAAPVATCTRGSDVVVDTVEVWARATTTLTMPKLNLVAGSTSTVTATVASPGAPVAGEVEFTVDGVTTSVPVAAGKATVPFPAKPAGNYAVSAVYRPTSSTMLEVQPVTPLTVEVAAAATSTRVALQPARITTAGTSTAKVTVTSPAGNPLGSAKVVVAGQELTAPLDNGVAEIPLPQLPTGDHPVLASFVPANAGWFVPSSAAETTLQVREPATPTTTTLTLDRTTGTTADPVRATVQVNATSGTPAGTVKVQIGSKAASGTLDENGRAVITLPRLTAGPHEVVASFAPADPDTFDPSESAASTLVLTAPLNLSETSTVLGLSATDVKAGTPVTATVTVNSTGGLADGEVDLTVAGRTLTAPVTNGRGQVQIPGLAPGTHRVTAAFTADAGSTFLDSEASAVDLVVRAAASRTSLSLSPVKVPVDADLTVTVNVAGNDADGGAAGSVQVTAGAVTGTGQVVNGTATVVLSGLPAGKHAVRGTFTPAASSWLTGSTSAPVDVTVLAPAVTTTTSLVLDSATVTEGATTRALATVTGAGASGSVRFTANGQTWTVPVVGGTAALSLPALAVGSHQVTASFVSSDESVAGPSTAAPVTLTVTAKAPAGPAATRTTVTAQSAVRVNGTFTATATVTGPTGLAGQVVFRSGDAKVSVALAGGSATATLTATEVGTQGITAEFVPADTSKASRSLGTASVQVAKNTAAVRVKAKAKKKARTLVLTAVVGPVDPLCGGTVTFSVARGAKKFKGATVPVTCSGTVKATVKLPRKKGTYTVTASFSGSTQTESATATGAFKR